MNNADSTVIRIPKKDYQRLPFNQRLIDNGPKVLTIRNGRPVYVKAELI